MDKAAEELNKISHILLDTEIRLNTATIQVQDLDRQIALLNSLEAHLEENISTLKSMRATVMASEYKKAKYELHTARNKRAFLRMDRQNCIKMRAHWESVYEKVKLDYERCFERLHNPPDNVIKGNFGRKNGQK